jgi:guanine deaminase
MCLGAIYWARPAAVYYSGTHTDAAEAGFDDSLIYNETRLPVERRLIPMKRLLPEQGSIPFDEWKKNSLKIPY